MVRLARAGGYWSNRQVSNWINSGGHAPRQYTGNDNAGTSGGRCAGVRKTPLRLGLVMLLSMAAAQVGHARDPDGRYAHSPLKEWFDSLRSGKGPCCSDADGTAASDVDWESSNGHYRVRLEGDWIDVPEEAVITEPN